MIKQAKKRGYVTHEQLNAVLPSEEVTSDQIEDIYAMLNEMGINVVDSEDSADDEEGRKTDDDDEGGELVEVSPSRWPSPRPRSRPSAPTIPCACICARWARWSCSRARARSPSPSASRPAARR
jgi:RNA polymerase primary sigma factor